MIKSIFALIVFLCGHLAIAATPGLIGVSDPVDAGRMRNPFLSWIGPLSRAQQTCYSNDLRCQNTLVGPSPWFLSRMIIVTPSYKEGEHYRDEDRTIFAFRLDASGQPIDQRRVSTDMSAISFTEDARFLSAQQNDRWWVIPQTSQDSPEAPPGESYNFEGFLVFGLGPNGWNYHKIRADSTPRGLRSAKLLGDHLIYAYINNPAAKVEKSSTDIEQKGTPSFCIADIDLNTRERTLLASSGQITMDTPLLTEKLRVIRRIIPLGLSAFTVGEVNRLSGYAYDLQLRSWRTMTTEEKQVARVENPRQEQAFESIMIGKDYWKLWPYLKDGRITVKKVGLDSLQIPIDLDHHGIQPSNLLIAESSRKALNDRAKLDLSVNFTPEGLVLSDRWGAYFWIRMDNFRAAVQQAYDRLMAQKPPVAK